LLVAFALRGSPDPSVTPGDSTSPVANSATTTVWPENAINGASPGDVQAALDSGDDSLRWRADPEQVLQRFGLEILGRNLNILGVTEQEGGAVAQAWPCPPGELPIGKSCDALQGEPLTFRLAQPATRGEGGIWSVESVTSEALNIDVAYSGLPLHEGSRILFDISRLDPASSAHVGIVASNGCNEAHADDTLPNGLSIVEVPELSGSTPACAASPGGYAYAYVTDDTTLPSPDPIEEPTAIESPWITIVPITLPLDPSSVTRPTPSAPTETATTIPFPEGLQLCNDNPATRVVILERDISLAGCVAWAADTPIDLTLQNRDTEVLVGLALSRPSDCDERGCSGDPIWSSDLISGIDSKAFAVDPLPAGDYVLWDVVHPTSRLDIVVK
jgi:hypothetical protein